MTTAPRNARISSPNLRANGETQIEFLSPRILTREAAKVCADLHLNLSGGRLRTLVNRYIAHGRADVSFRTWFISYADPTLGRRLTYADPTGKKAVRNVLRGAK